MPRQKNTRPTNIYWLYDIRPETIAEGWPQMGKPFYCGKTVSDPEKRLIQHRRIAANKLVGARIVTCGQFIRAQTVEIVPVDQDWCAREKFWIATMRLLYPECCLNVSDGGSGVPGYIPTAETRAKIGFAARHRSPETLAKIAAGAAGNTRRRGIKQPADVRAKISAAHVGKKRSPEHCASLSAMARRRSPETLAKIGKSLLGNTNAKGKKKCVIALAKRTVTRKARRNARLLGSTPVRALLF